jgi:hypothetical protein
MKQTPLQNRGRLFLAALVGFLAWPVWNSFRSRRVPPPAQATADPVPEPDERRQRRSRGPAFALAGVAMTLLLFGGAALATAADDLVGAETTTNTTSDSTSSDEMTTSSDGEVTQPSAPEAPTDPAPPAPPPPAPPPPGAGDSKELPVIVPPVAPQPEPVPIVPPAWLDKPETAAPDPEIEDPNSAATIWLYRVLPDPTPRAKRLDPLFARRLSAIAERERVAWSLLLGVLRANGRDGTEPATAREMTKLARHLVAVGVRKRPWAALVAYSARPDFADQAIALDRYNRAVGLGALVRGLAASKDLFQKRILASSRIDLYPLGRLDIAAGRIDVRVLVLILYLRQTFGEVTVSSLRSGHRLFARPNVVSAHIYGLAVDISALGGVSVAGNQRPGGLTELAVRDILLLPTELQPRQVISLLGLGGASFPLADHGDHIHVGY